MYIFSYVYVPFNSITPSNSHFLHTSVNFPFLLFCYRSLYSWNHKSLAVVIGNKIFDEESTFCQRFPVFLRNIHKTRNYGNLKWQMAIWGSTWWSSVNLLLLFEEYFLRARNASLKTKEGDLCLNERCLWRFHDSTCVLTDFLISEKKTLCKQYKSVSLRWSSIPACSIKLENKIKVET